MNLRAAVRRRPTIAFFVAAFALTWVVWVPRALGSAWAVGLGAVWTYMPAVAALLVAAVVGHGAVRDLGRRLTRWRVPLRWYAVVLLGPAAFWAVVLAVVGVLGLLGVPYDGTAAPRPPGADLGVRVLPVLVVLALTDGLGEEAGWRGFALPRLLGRLPGLAASVLLGLVWALWHLPLVWTEGAALEGASAVLLLLELPARSIVFTRVFGATGGSALIAILLHVALSLSTVTAAVAWITDRRVAVVVLLLEWLVAATVLPVRSRRRSPVPAAPQVLAQGDVRG
jgi:uncharacterized protein